MTLDEKLQLLKTKFKTEDFNFVVDGIKVDLDVKPTTEDEQYRYDTVVQSINYLLMEKPENTETNEI